MMNEKNVRVYFEEKLCEAGKMMHQTTTDEEYWKVYHKTGTLISVVTDLGIMDWGEATGFIDRGWREEDKKHIADNK